LAHIRILIADDHVIVREGIRTLLGSVPEMEVVGEAADGAEAIAKTRELDPDVVLMDLIMPGINGIDAISAITRENPDVRILVLTSFSEEDMVFRAIEAGALGYLLKDSSPAQLIQAIQDVHGGQASLHPSIALKLIKELKRPSTLPPAEQPLTGRELAVLKLVAQGLTNPEIAERLVISEWTVRTHIRNVLGKLHLANRTQAALYAVREGLVDLDKK
jgi:two-component system, NarL family, response regulator LiaR